MAITQIIINRTGEERFSFEYSNESAGNLEQVREDIARFIDDAVDTLLRLTNKYTLNETKKLDPLVYVKLEAGNHL